MFQLRVIRAFRSTLEDLNERRSMHSLHSLRSPRSGGIPGHPLYNFNHLLSPTYNKQQSQQPKSPLHPPQLQPLPSDISYIDEDPQQQQRTSPQLPSINVSAPTSSILPSFSEIAHILQQQQQSHCNNTEKETQQTQKHSNGQNETRI